jgi:hypothetical protein
MDVSPEIAMEHLRRWKSSSSPLSVAVGCNGLKIFSTAIVKGVSRELLYLGLSQNGGLTLRLSRAKRFRTFLPAEVAPSDVGIANKCCALLLVITLEDGTLCRVCESNQANFRVVLFSDVDREDKMSVPDEAML